MNLLIICLFIAALLPLLSKLPLAAAMHKEEGGYDNNYPRLQAARLVGFGSRALAAHLNSYESLVIFTAAIATALATRTFTTTVQYLAVIHIIARCFYHIFYMYNWASLRSTIWAIGYFCSIAIILLCLA